MMNDECKAEHRPSSVHRFLLLFFAVRADATSIAINSSASHRSGVSFDCLTVPDSTSKLEPIAHFVQLLSGRLDLADELRQRPSSTCLSILSADRCSASQQLPSD